MKKFLCVLLVLMLLSSTAFAGDYNDIADHWAKDYILSNVGEKIVNGYEDGSFKPEDFVTHAEFITMINRFIGAEKTAEHKIANVSDDDWFATEIKKAVGEGYVSDKAEFLPNEPIMRGVACGFLAKALKLQPDYDSLKKFSDFEKIAYAEIGSLVKLGIVDGFKDGTFKPADSLTRAEACKLFYVANEKLNIIKEDKKVEEDKLPLNKIETAKGDLDVSFMIYGSKQCPHCNYLKEYLDGKEIAYNFEDISGNGDLTKKIYDEFYKDVEPKDGVVYYPTTIISAVVDGKEIKKSVVGFDKEQYDKIFEEIKAGKYFAVKKSEEPAPAKPVESASGMNKIETVNGEREVVFTIYGFEQCPWCQRLKAYLDEKNISYTFDDIRGDAELKKEVYAEFYMGRPEKYARVYYPTTIISSVVDGKEVRKGVVGFETEDYDKIFEDIKNDVYFK